jgi:thymidylate kinase
MSLIVIEGIDTEGKSAIANQLKTKYPKQIEIIKFPSIDIEEGLEKQQNDVKTLIYNHILFEIDFHKSIDKLQQQISKGKLLILIRYFPSNIVYLQNNIEKYRKDKKTFDILTYYLSLINEIDRGIKPDLVILLNSKFQMISDDKGEKEVDTDNDNGYYDINKFYTQNQLLLIKEKFPFVLYRLKTQKKIHDFKIVDFLQPDSLLQIENILKDKGFL